MKVREGNTEWVTYFPGEGRDARLPRGESRPESFRGEPEPPALDENGQPVVIEAVAAPVEKSSKKNGVHRRARKVELYESTAVQKLIAELDKKGLMSTTSPTATRRSSS